MKIAIVDDSAKDLSAEIDYLTSYISKNKISLAMNLKISGFQTSADFLKSFEPGKFDLIALDIVMNDMNGIQLAKKIRARDSDCDIIFITSSTEFSIEGYSVFAVGYFIKPLSDHEAEFKKTFEFVCAKFEKNLELPVTVTRNVRLNVPYKDIYFVDINDKHKVRITTKNSEMLITMSYAQCQEILLNDKRFLECHYRIIVNMDYIQSMKEEDFILKNGMKIPISQRKRRESKLTYLNHILHRND